jgi:hypothetical protein
MACHAGSDGQLGGAITHFQKVTHSYRPGLFASYDLRDLRRMNNCLERLFGAHRYHERWAGGRIVASPGTVVRGAVRLVASAATRLWTVVTADLAPATWLLGGPCAPAWWRGMGAARAAGDSGVTRPPISPRLGPRRSGRHCRRSLFFGLLAD